MGRAVVRGQPLHFHVGDDVAAMRVAVSVEFRRVIGAPAGCPDHGADVQIEALALVVRIERAIGAGRLEFLALSGRDRLGGDDVAHRIGVLVRQVGRLHLVEAVVEGIVHQRLGRVRASAACGAILLHEARATRDRGLEIAARAGNRADFAHRHHANARVLADALIIDLEPAIGMAELGKIAIELRDAPAEAGVALDENDFVSGFRRFERRRHPCNAAADNENCLAGRSAAVPAHPVRPSRASPRRFRRWGQLFRNIIIT